MYKIETLRKLMIKANELFIEYKGTGKAPKLTISNGNRKIGKVMNFSMMPMMTCGNCKECKHFCYDVKACVQYASCLDARIRNTILAKMYRDELFQMISEKCRRRRKNLYFRWHVSGDILDGDYFERMIKVCRENPQITFWTYTKMYNIVNDYVKANGRDAIPGNFTIMFSEWDGVELINPYNFPEFTCKLKEGNKNHGAEYFDGLYECPGNCDICKANGRGCIAGETTYAKEH